MEGDRGVAGAQQPQVGRARAAVLPPGQPRGVHLQGGRGVCVGGWMGCQRGSGGGERDVGSWSEGVVRGEE